MYVNRVPVYHHHIRRRRRRVLSLDIMYHVYARSWPSIYRVVRARVSGTEQITPDKNCSATRPKWPFSLRARGRPPIQYSRSRPGATEWPREVILRFLPDGITRGSVWDNCARSAGVHVNGSRQSATWWLSCLLYIPTPRRRLLYYTFTRADVYTRKLDPRNQSPFSCTYYAYYCVYTHTHTHHDWKWEDYWDNGRRENKYRIYIILLC